jgi:TPR repeat protein
MSRPAIVPPSPVRSLEDQPYRKAAEQGDAEAQSRLGDLYAKGIGVGRDYGEAAKRYRKAADQGDASAQNNLGMCYARGEGVSQDYAEAVTWYRKAADQGDASAQTNLGFCCDIGQGVQQDYAEAVKWYRRAAEQGYAIAEDNLGHCYQFGHGIQQDDAEAVKWYRKAAEVGLPSAQNDFAWMLAISTDASLRNGLLAVTFAEKAVTATRRSDDNFLDTLAAAYAEAGDFEKAVAIQNEAITLLKDAASKQDYTSRLRLYEAKTPYREAEKE